MSNEQILVDMVELIRLLDDALVAATFVKMEALTAIDHNLVGELQHMDRLTEALDALSDSGLT